MVQNRGLREKLTAKLSCCSQNGRIHCGVTMQKRNTVFESLSHCISFIFFVISGVLTLTFTPMIYFSVHVCNFSAKPTVSASLMSDNCRQFLSEKLLWYFREYV